MNMQTSSVSDQSQPSTVNMSRYARQTIRRALNLLENQLREPGVAFCNTDVTRDWLRLHLAGKEREVFMGLFLDNQHRLITHEALFNDTINRVDVYPREVVKLALRSNVAAVILAHNHPSGQAEPSKSDRFITDKLTQALALVDVRVLDHLVFGGMNVVSFAERGWL